MEGCSLAIPPTLNHRLQYVPSEADSGGRDEARLLWIYVCVHHRINVAFSADRQSRRDFLRDSCLIDFRPSRPLFCAAIFAAAPACRLAAGGGHESCLAVLLAAVDAAAASSARSPFNSRDAYHRASLIDVADVYGSNASHYACRAGEDGALALLADAGACLELPSGAGAGGASSAGGVGLHPAHLAVAHGFLFCLEELASRGVDLEAADGDGETPLSLAVQVCSLWSVGLGPQRFCLFLLRLVFCPTWDL